MEAGTDAAGGAAEECLAVVRRSGCTVQEKPSVRNNSDAMADIFGKLFDGPNRNRRFDIVSRQRVILLTWINHSRIDARALDMTFIKKSGLGLFAAMGIPSDFYYSALW